MLFAFAVSPLFCAIGACNVLGVAAAAVARLTEGTRHECMRAVALPGGPGRRGHGLRGGHSMWARRGGGRRRPPWP